MSTNPGRAADLLLVNGRILTMGAPGSVVQALAIRDGKVLARGSDSDVQALGGPETRVIDLDGKTALPGLTDCHVHLATDAGHAARAIECRDLYDPGIESIADIQARLRQAAQSSAPGTWIIGRGSPLQDYRLRERRLPTRAELDEAVPERPAYVTFGAHVMICNTPALKERNITRDTPSPQGGTVVKDPATGEPTGFIRERAQFLIKPKAEIIGVEEWAEGILLELEKCLARGVTGIHDIITTREEVLAYQHLARQGRLPIRVQMLIRVIESNFKKESLLDLGIVHGFGSDWLKVGGIKMSVDGGFTGKNAAFSEPLHDHGEENPGLIRITQDELDETVGAYHALGMRICTHAMGDAAVDMVVDAYEKALARLPRRDHRHRIEHMGNWCMSAERIARVKRLGILPMSNPSFLYFFGDPSVEMLGERMTAEGYPFRSMWEAGIPVAFGSDSPGYFPVDPLRDVGAATAHVTLGGTRINPSEGLGLEQALRCVTSNAAFAGFVEDRLGSLEVGKLADVTVLAEDPFTFPPEKFARLPVQLTVSGGQVVYDRRSIEAAV